jgi:hypothetical protein
LVESRRSTVSALAQWFRALTENDRGTRRTMIVPPLLALIEVEAALDFDVAEHLEIRDLSSVAVLDEDHSLEQVKPTSRELLSPPGSSLRCDLRSKKSTWLMTAFRLSTPKGLVMRNAGSGDVPVKKRSG